MKIKSIILSALLVMSASACTDLEEEFFSVVPSSEYGKTSGEIKTIAGSAYSSLRGFDDGTSKAYPASEYIFFLLECVSDEVCVPTRGADWYDNGRYQQAQYHTLSPDNAMVLGAWRYCYEGISKCNFVIYTIETAGLPEEEAAVAKAEVRGVRAYYYYLLLDWFGNVPITTSFVDEESPAQSSRSEVYEFVESELLDIADKLQAGVEYARFTQNVCNTLLARLYINSSVFLGAGNERWQDCIDACDKITAYKLTPKVLDNWLTENQNSSEIIFSIPYDHAEGTTGNYLPSLTFHYNHWQTVSATASGWTWSVNGICAQPGVFSSFEAGDDRRACMAEGYQINITTFDTILDRAGNKLNYTETIDDFTDAKEFEGVRLHKMEIKEGEFPERDHDWVLMRYAEIIMMKAECLWRLTGTNSESVALINQIRKRSGLDPVSTVDESILDQEWLHEFLFEGIRRPVNLRFGTYNEAWWSKPANSKDMEIFPIPETELVKNTKLKQNPGY